jgi:peptide/nickel transport system substrate-binding protein
MARKVFQALGRIRSLILIVAVSAAAVSGPALAQKQGGVLKIAVPSVKPGLDPAFTTTADGYMLTQAIFSNLVRIDENLEVQPQLAKRWEPNENNTVFRFELVQGVKFHNGRELTAEDVVFSIKRILDPATGSQGRKFLGPIKDVKADGKYAVVVELTQSFADLPIQLANPFARIIAKENLDKISSAPIGTGPFRLKEYIQGSRAVLVRNPDYFERGLPHLNEFHQVYLKENAAQLAAIKAGQVDVLYQVADSLIPLLRNVPDIEVRHAAAPAFQAITFFIDKKPTDDPRVRQALRLAADRPAMMVASAGAYGTPGNDTPVSPVSRWYEARLPERKQDINRARKLLAEAGYPNGIDLTLYTSSARPGLEEAAVAFRESVKAAGIRINIQSVDIARLYSEIARKPRENTLVHLNWLGRPTIDESLTPYYRSGAGFNYSGYSNPRVDELLGKGQSAKSPAERKAIYDEVQRILWEDGPDLIAYFRAYVTAVRKNVKNYRLIPVQYVDLRSVWVE